MKTTLLLSLLIIYLPMIQGMHKSSYPLAVAPALYCYLLKKGYLEKEHLWFVNTLFIPTNTLRIIYAKEMTQSQIAPHPQNKC